MILKPPAISICVSARAISWVGLVCVLCGCEPGAVDSKSAAPGAPNVVSVGPPAVRIADRAELDRVIATHRGKVVLVDFWATWCGPCVQQFPHSVALSSANPDHLAVISVSMDEAEDLERVQRFLQSQNAEFEHLLSKYGVGQEGFEAFAIDDGSIPHYQIYDRDGVLRHKLQDSTKLASLVDALLRLEPAE